MSGLERWLPPLEPPPGGHRRLAEALARRRGRASRHAWQGRLAGVAASLSVVALAIVLAQARDPARVQARRVAVELAAAWQADAADLAVDDGAALEVLRQPGLRVYWVDVDPAKASASSSSPSPSR